MVMNRGKVYLALLLPPIPDGIIHMLRLRLFFPIRMSTGDYMKTCVFYPEQVIKEDRIWLKNNLKKIMSFRKKLVETIDFCNKTLEPYK